MRRIFVGMLLIFLNFNINIGNSVLGLIPTFIGYFVMRGGVAEMAATEPGTRFARVRPFVTAMTAYTAVCYALDLLGASAELGGLGAVLGLVSTAASLYVAYCIVRGVADIENGEGRDLDAARLYSVWRAFAVLELAVVVLSVLLPALALVCAILLFVVAVMFLFAFNRSKNLYYA
ncbi:MAG: hypothetical protein LBN99_06815 [Oscillospiraceae bacterium]|jgi:hypothetical protein|nr:hypothetical protein [Oscillospiraceae bacterium]